MNQVGFQRKSSSFFPFLPAKWSEQNNQGKQQQEIGTFWNVGHFLKIPSLRPHTPALEVIPFAGGLRTEEQRGKMLNF